jgi:hypothetical protein
LSRFEQIFAQSFDVSLEDFDSLHERFELHFPIGRLAGDVSVGELLAETGIEQLHANRFIMLQRHGDIGFGETLLHTKTFVVRAGRSKRKNSETTEEKKRSENRFHTVINTSRLPHWKIEKPDWPEARPMHPTA